MRILVVDDDPDVGRALQRMLRCDDVVVETDSFTGVARVLSAEFEGDPFEVVLCDFRMPGMNGLDVLAEVRGWPEPPMLILMSGDDDIVNAASVADAVLIKPCRRAEIRACIEEVKGTRQRAVTQRIRRMHATTAELR